MRSVTLHFGLLALLIIAVQWGFIRLHAMLDWGTVPEWPVAFDLLITLPLAYAWLHRKQHPPKQLALRTLAVAGLGVAIGAWLLPPESKWLWRALEPLRWLALAVVLALELFLLVSVARALWRAWPNAQSNREAALQATLATRLGASPFMPWLMVDMRMWLYALARDPVGGPFTGQRHFTVHRQHQNASNQQAFLVLIGLELPIAHGFMHLFWGPWVAGAMTLLSLYGFVFLLADYRATLKRPISLDGGWLRVRYGLMTDVAVPLAAITDIAVDRNAAPRHRSSWSAVGMGRANVRLRLRPYTVPAGMLIAKPVGEMRLGLDEPEAFVKAVQDALASPGSDTGSPR
jgi:hypothetical protein